MRATAATSRRDVRIAGHTDGAGGRKSFDPTSMKGTTSTEDGPPLDSGARRGRLFG